MSANFPDQGLTLSYRDAGASQCQSRVEYNPDMALFACTGGTVPQHDGATRRCDYKSSQHPHTDVVIPGQELVGQYITELPSQKLPAPLSLSKVVQWRNRLAAQAWDAKDTQANARAGERIKEVATGTVAAAGSYVAGSGAQAVESGDNGGMLGDGGLPRFGGPDTNWMDFLVDSDGRQNQHSIV